AIPEGEAGVTLVLDGALPAQPGQFVMAWLPGVEERPLSVMDDAPLSLTVAAVGPFTQALCALQPGDRLWVRGPYGRGFELAGRLRRKPTTRCATLIALTGFADEGVRSRAREAGFDHLLVKPPDMSELDMLLATAGQPARTPVVSQVPR
ncbi:MAG: hypothetical protein JJ992_07020, partial [Planctomycetes bacterium]|nr:hypothetical protein [Planctomycetota bacterium]